MVSKSFQLMSILDMPKTAGMALYRWERTILNAETNDVLFGLLVEIHSGCWRRRAAGGRLGRAEGASYGSIEFVAEMRSFLEAIGEWRARFGG